MICIIPARGGSKGIKDKNLQDVHGYPLVMWTIKQALDSGVFERIYVSSDDLRIIGCANACDVSAVERPSELATDTVATVDVLRHFVRTYDIDDDVCLLQCTNPLRKKGDIEAAVKMYKDANKGAYRSVVSVTADSNVCMWNDCAPVTFGDRLGRQEKRAWHIENGSIYITHSSFLAQGMLSPNPVGFYVMEPWQRFEIDEPWDLELIKWIMKNKSLV